MPPERLARRSLPRERPAFAGLFQSPLTDSNRRPPPYHGGALPTELRGRSASVALPLQSEDGVWHAIPRVQGRLRQVCRGAGAADLREDLPQLSERPAVPVDAEAMSTLVRVRPYRLGDEDALVEMSRSAFPMQSASLAKWRWCFRQAPEGPADILVLESEGRVVGGIVHVPVAVWLEGRRHRLAIGCDP